MRGPAVRLQRLGVEIERTALTGNLCDETGEPRDDLEPPLVGPPPLAWMKQRVPELRLEGTTPDALRTELATLPGQGPT
ncbi:MAG: hypothetical protein ABI321_01090, partial [Polyangia bacterium]